MSLNIPSYYYTDIYKRVPGESIESMKAKLANMSDKFVNDLRSTHATLDVSKSIDLSKNGGQSTLHLSDEAREKLEDSKKSLAGITSADLDKTLPDREVTVMNKEGQPLAYYNFKNLIDHMTELDDTQKSTLRNAIITSTESAESQQQDSTTFGMNISQTNMELKYISNKIVPEKYQEQFNSIVDKYTDGLTEKFTNLLEIFDTAFMNSSAPSAISSGWKEAAKEELASLKNGTDMFHTSKKAYDELYKNVDITNDDKLKEGLSSVYDNFMKNNASYIKATGAVDQAGLVNEVKYLSEKWNAVIDEMNSSSTLKFITSLNCLS